MKQRIIRHLGVFADEIEEAKLVALAEDLILKIKETAFNNTLALIPNKEISLVFFDVTTLYFESIEVEDIRKFGYSQTNWTLVLGVRVRRL